MAVSWRPWSHGAESSLWELCSEGPNAPYTLASTWAGRGRISSSFSGSGPGGWGGPGVLHPDSLGLGPGRGAWFCDLDIPTFLKLSEEAASGLQCMERSGRGLAGNELPCCRDGNGITAAGGISVRGGGPSMPTLSQVRVGVPGMLVRLALSGTPAHQSCSCGSPAVPGPAQRAQLRASTDQAPPWGRAVSHP